MTDPTSAAVAAAPPRDRWRGFTPARARLALLLLWSLELWLVQHDTCSLTLWSDPFMFVKDRILRAGFDLALLGIATFALPRVVLVPWMLVTVAFDISVLSYHEAYGRSLSVLTILTQSGEGAGVFSGAWALLGGWVWFLVPAWLVRLVLAWRATEDWAFADRRRWKVVQLLAAAYAIALVWVNFDHREIKRIALWEQVGGIAHVFGYLPAWTGELVYTRREQVEERARQRAQIQSDKLTPIENAFPLRRNLVFLQVESLDWDVTQFSIKDVKVTPRLQELRARSMDFAVLARKITGSCDTDYTAMMGHLPSQDIPSYRIPTLAYSHALPHLLADRGFVSVFFHGVGGSFFERRPAYEKMGFESLHFQEELVEEGAPLTEWTLADSDVFDAALDVVRTPATRRFTFVITASSHLPFRYTTKSLGRPFFGHVEDYTRNYFDSIHYVDDSIGRFVDGLPPDTTVVIYGDHWAKVNVPELGYQPKLIDGFGRVPFLIYNVGEDLSGYQKTRGLEVSHEGTLELLDMFTWIRNGIRSAPGLEAFEGSGGEAAVGAARAEGSAAAEGSAGARSGSGATHP